MEKPIAQIPFDLHDESIQIDIKFDGDGLDNAKLLLPKGVAEATTWGVEKQIEEICTLLAQNMSNKDWRQKYQPVCSDIIPLADEQHEEE